MNKKYSISVEKKGQMNVKMNSGKIIFRNFCIIVSACVCTLSHFSCV